MTQSYLKKRKIFTFDLQTSLSDNLGSQNIVETILAVKQALRQGTLHKILKKLTPIVILRFSDPQLFHHARIV